MLYGLPVRRGEIVSAGWQSRHRENALAVRGGQRDAHVYLAHDADVPLPDRGQCLRIGVQLARLLEEGRPKSKKFHSDSEANSSIHNHKRFIFSLQHYFLV